MLIVMQSDATREQIDAVCERIRQLGWTPPEIPGSSRVAIGITGNEGPIDPEHFSLLSGIAACIPVSKPYKLVSREVKPEPTVVDVGGEKVGGRRLAIMAGPCAVESREQILATAKAVRAAGARFLRGGAFKPRTSPYSFQGLKEEGLKLLAEARQATGLKIVTEVKDTETLEMVSRYADVLQIGARNMSNFSLLERVGNLDKPILLKRGISATLDEYLYAAEYILARGNYNVILCERGIRTFETSTRNTLDINAVAVLKRRTHLPVIVDPSHATGLAWAVPPIAKAGIVAGADGLLIEVHPDPPNALSDGQQSLTFESFAQLMNELRPLSECIGRSI